MLTLNDFAEDLRDVFPESIFFSEVPEPDVDFVTDLVKKQTKMRFLKVFGAFTIGLVNQLMLRIFLQIYFSICRKKKVTKIELLTRGQNDNKLWYNCRKEVVTALKGHSILTKKTQILKPTYGCVSI